MSIEELGKRKKMEKKSEKNIPQDFVEIYWNLIFSEVILNLKVL
tara:strand:- start:559 stop:690 length:132 start_codon:yes stop_codon:yes gene_type:complete